MLYSNMIGFILYVCSPCFLYFLFLLLFCCFCCFCCFFMFLFFVAFFAFFCFLPFYVFFALLLLCFFSFFCFCCFSSFFFVFRLQTPDVSKMVQYDVFASFCFFCSVGSRMRTFPQTCFYTFFVFCFVCFFFAFVVPDVSKMVQQYDDVFAPDVFVCRIVPFTIEPGECFKPELPHDAVIPTAGFPSLHVLMLGSVEERKIPVNVFGTASR